MTDETIDLGIWMLTTMGEAFLISAEDYDMVAVRRWHLSYARKASTNRKAYARVQTKQGDKNIKLHRLLLKAEKSDIVDHINRDPLDNRRSNLRFATLSENQRNREGRVTSTSKYRGVYQDKITKKWVAQTRPQGCKTIHCGVFMTEDEAHKAVVTARAKLGII